MPATSYQIPDVVLCQVITSNTQRNFVGEASTATLLPPSDVCSDGNKLIVANTWNYRVLIWNNSNTKFSNYRCCNRSTNDAK